MSEYVRYQDLEAKFGISRPTLKKRLKIAGVEEYCFPGGSEKYILKSDIDKIKPKGINSCQHK